MILRSIKQSAGRFAAIFAISALGVGFLAGISAATPDMRLSGSRYFTAQNMADIRVMSTLGLDDDDLAALREVPGVSEIMPVRSMDMLFETEGGTTLGLTVIGAPKDDMLSGNINRLELKEGRLPENGRECLLERTASAVKNLHLGDVITLSPQNDGDIADDFAGTELTVVGLVDNPMYMAMQREPTTIGNGRISDIIYVPESLFLTDYYTVFYMTARGADKYLSMTERYWDVVDPVVSRLEDIAEERKYIRRDKVIGEAQDKIDEAWETYYEKEAEAESGFAEAEEKMDKAQRDIDEGRVTLAQKEWEARQDLEDGRKELADAYDELTQAEVDLEDGQKKYDDGLKEYEEGRAEFIDGYLEYRDGLKKYNDGLEEYNKGLKEYEDGKKKYDDGVKQLEEARLRLVRGENQLTMGWESLEEGRQMLDGAQAELDAQAAGIAAMMGMDHITDARGLIAAADSDPMIAAALGSNLDTIRGAQAQLDAQRAMLEDSEAQLDSGGDAIWSGWEQYYEAKAELDDNGQKLEDAKAELDDAKAELDDARAQLDDAEAELQSGYDDLEQAARELKDAKKELEEGREEIDDGWQKYYDGQKELEDGQREFDRQIAKAHADIEDGQRQLEDGRREYEEKKLDAEEKLAEARDKIQDAQNKLDDIGKPKWYVLDRSGMVTPAGFDANIEKVASIAKVFPVFFFMIAALVCLTTMTRMVEEERGLIGTMKALGYSPAAISAKYLIYAFSASVSGCAVGLMAGFSIFPAVIWHAYGIMYRLPQLYTPFNWGYAIFASGSTIACVMLATYQVCRSSLRESAAGLMLPKAPQPGKRVLLEYVTPVWGRLSFNSKVTVRNLFRYKKRFFMTVAGVTGCTALLLTGFGLRDSIDDILHNQFDILWRFDLMAGVREEDGLVPGSRLETVLKDNTEEYMEIHQESATVRIGSGNTSEVTLYAPFDAGAFQRSYVVFRTRVGHDDVPFGPGTAVLTEKASRTIGASVGDTIDIETADGEETSVVISGITENYIQGFLYIAPDLYEDVFGHAPSWNMVFCRTSGLDEEGRSALAEEILSCSGAVSATFTEDTAAEFGDTFKSIDMIIWVLIVSAGLLAFVVLYNLTNINIGERNKEIATLKVLGFYEGEVASYILRETVGLSLIGAVCGLGAGKILHGFVARTAEVDMVMFGRVIVWKSYLLALGLTMLFTLMVAAVMAGKLRRISMVESLKAPE